MNKTGLNLCVSAQPVILRSLLRDNETFSTYLVDSLSVPPAVVRSLMRAEIKLNPVSIASPLRLSRFWYRIRSAFRKHTSPLYGNQLNVNVFKPPGLPENLVFEHSEIECLGEEPPLGVRSLTDIIKAKRGFVIGGCVQQVIWNWIILPQQWQHLVCLSTDTLVFTKIRWAERR